MPEIAYNLVTFRTADLPGQPSVRLLLTLTSAWSVRGGIDPALNTAVVPASEFDKLGFAVLDRRGTIEFWDAADPREDPAATPSVALANQWIVESTPDVVGYVAAAQVPSAVSFRLTFADFRHAFIAPRGGRLFHGEINPEMPEEGETLRSNRDLVTDCLDAMGASMAVPASLDDAEPVRGLSWLGAHAPSELTALLGRCGHVYCPHSSGTGYVARLGAGSLPPVPADRLVSDVTTPAADRRPREAVFFSAPTAVTLTYDQDAPGGDWEYVAQDDEGRWQPLSAVLPNAQAAVRGGFATVAEADRQRLRDQAYRCVRLKRSRFDPRQSPILREVHLPDETADVPHLRIEIATEVADEAWRNVQRSVEPATIDESHNVLIFAERLGRVPEGETSGVYPEDFEAIPIDDVRPTFSVEDYDQDAGRKRFFACGFLVQGTPSPISPEAAAQRLTGFRPGTAIYPAPDLRLIRLNDADANLAEVQAKAEGLAQLVAAGGLGVRREVTVRGFLAWEIDGWASEIRWDPATLTTTIVAGTWATPTGPGERYAPGVPPRRQATPRVPVAPAVRETPPSPLRPVRVRKTGGTADANPANWTYSIWPLGTSGAADPMAESVAVLHRQAGAADPPADDATALAVRVGSTWRLVSGETTGEKLKTEACS